MDLVSLRKHRHGHEADIGADVEEPGIVPRLADQKAEVIRFKDALFTDGPETR